MIEHDVEIGALELVSGVSIPRVVQRLTRYGAEPAADGSNVVFVAHALSGSSRALEWWDGLVGNRGLFELDRWCIVGVNVLGGCYGSTGPSSLAPDGRRWGPRFPVVTVADMVEAQRRALREIGIARVAVAIARASRSPSSGGASYHPPANFGSSRIASRAVPFCPIPCARR